MQKTYRAAEKKYPHFATISHFPPFLQRKAYYAILLPVWGRKDWLAPP